MVQAAWAWVGPRIGRYGAMPESADVRLVMPLMREFGMLARQRVGAGVTPLEYQRYLDLRNQIGRKFFASTGSGAARTASRRRTDSSPTRLVVTYPTRSALISSIIPSIQPAGLMVPTPFAAEVGTRFLVRVSTEREGESAEFPGTVVTSIADGALTLSTTNMGMSLKIERLSPAQAAGLSKLFDHELDQKLGLSR